MILSVLSNGASIAQSLKQWRESIARDAAVQAVNRAASKGNTEIKRDISRAYKLKYAEVGNSLRIIKASRKGPAEVVAEIRVRGAKSRNVILFLDTAPVRKKEQKRRIAEGTQNELRFTIRRDRPGKIIPGAFVMTYNRGTFVARREDGKIKSVRTIDVPGMFKARRIQEEVMRKIREEFLPIEMERGIRDAIRRAGLAK